MEQGSRKTTPSLGWCYRLIPAVAAALLAAIAFWGANKEILGLFHDDGIYAVVAKSVAQGSGYRIISLPGAPAQTKYPFLYSYLLSWLWSVNGNFPGNILLLKSLNIALLVILFCAALSFYRRAVSDSGGWATVFSLLLCTSPVIFTLTDYVLSDLLLVVLTVLALLFSWSGSGPAAFKRAWLPLAVVTGLACLTRSAAIPLILLGITQSLLFRRFREGALFIFTVLLIIAPWLIWVAVSGPPPSGSLFEYYSGYNFTGTRTGEAGWSLVRHWEVIAGNARHMLGSFDFIYLLPILPGFSGAVLLYSVIGMIASIRKDSIAVWSFFLFALALVLIWPFHPTRYMAPLIPLLLLFFFRGFKIFQSWVVGWAPPRWRPDILGWVSAAPILILALLNGFWLSSYLLARDPQTTRSVYGSRVPYGWQGFEESFDWIRRNTRKDTVLGTAYDPMYFLYTGRQAIRPALHRPATYFYPYGAAKPDVGGAEEIKAQMEKLRVEYLIIDPLDSFAEGKATENLFEQIVRAYGASAKLVFRSADGKHRVYALAN